MEATKDNRLIPILPQTDLLAEIRTFLIDRQARNLSPRTVEFYSAELRYFREYLEARGISSVPAIQATHVREYLLHLGEQRNAGGVHASFRCIRAFLRWWEREYEPRDWSNPMKKVAPPRVPVEPLEPLPVADLQAMLATCKGHTFTDDRDRTILLALLDTGCRASEFVALDAGDVDLASGAVVVRLGKGRKPRVTFLGNKCRRELARYLRHRQTAPDGPLWVTAEGHRLTFSGLREIVRRRARRAGVGEPGLHAFRRSFALLSLRNGANVYAIQKMLGHADLSVLRRYLALNEADLQVAHARGGPVDHSL